MSKKLLQYMLNNIKNALLKNKFLVKVPYTKLNLAILKLLYLENYINSYILNDNDYSIIIVLKYLGLWKTKPLFNLLKLISKKNNLIYTNYSKLLKNLNFLQYNVGLAIISSSSGLITHYTAKKLKKGGEVLCYFQ